MDRWMKVEEACQLLQISAYSMRKKLREGEIKGARYGNQWRIKEKDLEAYMKSCEKAAGARVPKRRMWVV